MRRVVIIGCIIVGFLLLMIPNVNSIEYQNQKNIITSDEPAICNLLWILYIIFAFSLLRSLLLANLIETFANLIGCDWTISVNRSLTTNTCNCD